MNENNFQYLRDQLLYTGFGEALELELKEKLKQGAPSFTLYHETYPEDRVARATLTFNKAKDSDMYFFNSYRVEMQKESISDSLAHTFYIGKSGNITLKEAQNLLMGRAINKDLHTREGHSFNGWVQMDFKQTDERGNFKLQLYHENYGYNLQGTLEKYPIKELQNETLSENLLRSLKKGNLQSVIFLKDGKEDRFYIMASPQFKTIEIYDSDFKKMDNRQFKDIKQLDVEYDVVGESKKKALHEDKNQPEKPKQAKARTNNRSRKL